MTCNKASPAEVHSSVVLSSTEVQPPVSLYVHGPEDLFVSQQLRATGTWEPFETKLVLERLHSGAVFLDIGANIGYFSVLAGRKVGASGKVFCFEPDPANADLLKRSVELNQMGEQVTVVQAGLSDRTELGALHLSENNFGDHQTYASDESRESLQISLLNGSEYLAGRTAKIDLIKIDVQGAEFKAMSGLLPYLQELIELPDILLELTPYSLREAGSSGRELIDLLAELKPYFFIVDHIEHQLVQTTAAELRQWCDNVDSCEGDRGFMNILLSADKKHTETR